MWALCTSMTMKGSLNVDGEMDSGVRVWDGSEGEAMVVSSLVRVATSSAWIISKVLSEADSKLLLELKVLSLSSSMSNATLACNSYDLFCVLYRGERQVSDWVGLTLICPVSRLARWEISQIKVNATQSLT